MLPVALSAPGGAPESDEVVLAAGSLHGAAEEPADDESGSDIDAGADIAAAEVTDDATDEGVVEERDATASTRGSTARQAAIASRRATKAASKPSARTGATARRSTATTKVIAARPAAAPAPPPPPPPPPAPAPAPVSGGDGVWDKLAHCESGNTNDPGAPYFGYWQFSEPTWQSVGEAGLPNEHPRERQLAAAKRLQAARGWAPWPDCSRRLGLQ